jgi:hypothetical protein
LTQIALLICVENSFWNHGGHGNFVDSFQKSFTLYVESGMKKKVESHIGVFQHQQAGQIRVVDKKELYKIVMEHCLCKLHSYCLYLLAPDASTFLNAAHSDQQAAVST